MYLINNILVSVSVIVPNYNHAKFLKERLDSIFSQTFQDFELIILDDCSTDNSREIIESYRNSQNVSIHYNSKNSGSPFKQWRKGIELAKGEYIWIAESDDVAEPNFLEMMVQKLVTGHGLAYCRSGDINKHGHKKSNFFWADGLNENRWKSDYENEGSIEIQNFLVYRNTIPNASACVFEKKLAPVDCGFDKMRFCGDWLFWLKLLEKTSIAYSSETLSHFRHHDGSTRNEKSPNEELQKKLEIISIIESTRKNFKLGLPQEDEFTKYDWVIKGFYRQLMIPKNLKSRIIFYSNRYYPNLYPSYRSFFRI
ncbi:MAG: glycosyltransferase family 2 protein [Bacteroidota bacterium]